MLQSPDAGRHDGKGHVIRGDRDGELVLDLDMPGHSVRLIHLCEAP